MPVRYAATVVAGKLVSTLALVVVLAPVPAFALRPVGEDSGVDSGSVQDAGDRPAAREAAGGRSPRSPGSSPSDDEFTPSERIEADSAVSFPVDI
jgi:hypothetical protein